MTNSEYHVEYEKHGFSVSMVRESQRPRYMILLGKDGVITGLPHPDDLTPEARVEEMTIFLKRNMLI